VERGKKELLHSLMLRLADGERAAFDPLYELLWPLLRGFAQRALAGSPDAEDAAQIAITKVFSRASEFDPERDALAWVLGVTAYECRTLRQKRRRLRDTPLDSEPARNEPSPEDVAVGRNLEAALIEVLGTLKQDDIETLRAVMAGRPPAVPAATFRKRVERALGRLRTAWSSRHDLDH
jgi:RNA polymerase sigma-70 factor (ECF subfamily)